VILLTLLDFEQHICTCNKWKRQMYAICVARLSALLLFSSKYPHLRTEDLCWRCSSGLWRRVDSQADTNVSEKHTPTVSIFRAETYCLHLQGQKWNYVFPKRWCLPTSPHGVTSHKNVVIFTAVRTSDLTLDLCCWIRLTKATDHSHLLVEQYGRPSCRSHCNAAVVSRNIAFLLQMMHETCFTC
jgi:hypothetical protein